MPVIVTKENPSSSSMIKRATNNIIFQFIELHVLMFVYMFLVSVGVSVPMYISVCKLLCMPKVGWLAWIRMVLNSQTFSASAFQVLELKDCAITPYFLRLSPSLGLKLIDSVRLAGQQASRSFLSLLPQQ